jgi:hypothetical protein
MEAVSSKTSRLIHGPRLLQTIGAARPTPFLVYCKAIAHNQKSTIGWRSLSDSSRNLAPESSLFSSGRLSHSTVPAAYFSQRPSLPANTIIRFVPQQTAWIVERMGKFNRILEPGLAILIPFIDRIAYVKSLKESAIEIPSQNAITADNVTLELDGVLYTRVFDAYKARYVRCFCRWYTGYHFQHGHTFLFAHSYCSQNPHVVFPCRILTGCCHD